MYPARIITIAANPRTLDASRDILLAQTNAVPMKTAVTRAKVQNLKPSGISSRVWRIFGGTRSRDSFVISYC